jgi:predicted  nucleic acid-binding Zn-ribbon protein
MSAEQPHAGATALGRYREERQAELRARAAAALQRLDATGEAINFSSVAIAAGVSRQWLYTSSFRNEIEELRTRSTSASKQPKRPVREAASDASLRSRLSAMQLRNVDLRNENAALHEQLERALGLLRQHNLDY